MQAPGHPRTPTLDILPRLPASPGARPLARCLALAGLLTLACADDSQAQESASAGAGVSAQALPEVTVSADAAHGGLPPPHAGGQVARGGRLGMLGDTSVMQAPFNLTSYTQEMVRNQQSATLADAVNKDPSVRFTGLSGGNIDNMYIRGFPIGEGNSGEIAFDGLYGVAPNYRVFTDYVERIEVLKGPAALLYGMSPNSGVGGVINIVPKRATEALTTLSASYASDAQLGAQLDVARRFGPDQSLGVRVNGSYYGGDTPLDNQSRQAGIGALALDYQGRRLRASLDLIAQEERLDAPSRPFLLAPGLAVPEAPEGRRNVTQAWEWTKGRDESALLRLEYELNDQWSLFADAGGGRTRLSRLFGTTPAIVDAAGDTRSTPTYFKFNVDRATANAGLRGRFATGPVRHALTLQASAYSDSQERANTSGTPVASNIYNPIARPAQNVPPPSSVPRISDNDQSGIALADTLAMRGERVLLTLGLRQQRVQSRNFSPATGAVTSAYDEHATTPMAGLVVKPWEKVSLYANAIEGLSRGDVAPPNADNAGEVFAPYKARQYEIGAKAEFGRLGATAALFQITKPSGQMDGRVFSVAGQQRNRGLELNVFGEVARGVRLLGGVAFIDGKITESANPATVGKTAIGVPEVQANLGAEWDLPWLPGLTLTGAVIHTAGQYVNQANTASLPAWTKFDLGARYVAQIAGKATTLRANVLNVFDSDYWSGVTSWGGFSTSAPRTLLLSASVDF